MTYKNILKRDFFERDTIIVAKELLGTFLMRKIDSNMLVGKIVETEAYLPFDDPAAHNFVGRTKRNDVLFGQAGHAYVHSIHRYHCIDIVTEKIDIPGSILIRAVEPVEGIDIMKLFRKTKVETELTNGPGKVCEAFQITRVLNGTDVTSRRSPIVIASSGEKTNSEHLVIAKRIGISKAVAFPLRFYLKNSLHISRKHKE